MAKKVITHRKVFIASTSVLDNSDIVDKICRTNLQPVDVVSLNCMLYNKTSLSIDTIRLIGDNSVTTLLPHHCYLITSYLWGVHFYYAIRMLDEINAIMVSCNHTCANVLGTKLRWAVSKGKNNSCKQLLLSNSKNNMLVQVGDDPLNIMELSRLPRTDQETIMISKNLSDKINLWDYDADHPVIKPHIFRLMVTDKLILNKPIGV